MEDQNNKNTKRKRPREDILVSLVFLVVLLLFGGSAFLAWKHYITSPPYIDPQRFPMKGIDVSSHNGDLDLKAAADDGISFIFIKATEGESFRDHNFPINYTKAGEAGLKRGAYHFFRFDCDGVSQALNLVNAIDNRQLELGIAIDVEDQGNPGDIPTDTVIQRLMDLTDYLILEGHRVMFYSNRAGYEKYLFENFRGFPLWICSFEEDTAKDSDWTFWQYNHRGKVAGINGNVDLNVCSLPTLPDNLIHDKATQ